MKYVKDLNGRIVITPDHIERVPRPRIYDNTELDSRIQNACKEVLRL